MFWVISVYFKIRNTHPKSGTFLLGHPVYIAHLLSEIRQIFQFKEHIVNESQRLLHSASSGMKNFTYVGVHVRKTDFTLFLRLKYNASPVKPNNFLRQMDLFRNKYQQIVFVVVSDDSKWCESELRGDDVYVIRKPTSST